MTERRRAEAERIVSAEWPTWERWALEAMIALRELLAALGVGGFCLPETSLSDHVTHGDMQAELSRLREAISLLASRLDNELGTNDARRILTLLAPPEDR